MRVPRTILSCMAVAFTRTYVDPRKMAYRPLNRYGIKIADLAIVSDPRILSTSCNIGLAIPVGCYFDPPEIPGLAHLMEHSVFLGSKNYPYRFDQYMSEIGGTTNAATMPTSMVFAVEIPCHKLEETVGRMIDFVFRPLLDPEDVISEVSAVNAEHERNMGSEQHRMWHAIMQLFGPPISKFGTGSRDTLLRDDIGTQVARFHNQYVKLPFVMFVSGGRVMHELENLAVGVLSNANYDSMDYPSLDQGDYSIGNPVTSVSIDSAIDQAATVPETGFISASIDSVTYVMLCDARTHSEYYEMINYLVCNYRSPFKLSNCKAQKIHVSSYDLISITFLPIHASHSGAWRSTMLIPWQDYIDKLINESPSLLNEVLDFVENMLITRDELKEAQILHHTPAIIDVVKLILEEYDTASYSNIRTFIDQSVEDIHFNRDGFLEFLNTKFMKRYVRLVGLHGDIPEIILKEGNKTYNRHFKHTVYQLSEDHPYIIQALKHGHEVIQARSFTDASFDTCSPEIEDMEFFCQHLVSHPSDHLWQECYTHSRLPYSAIVLRISMESRNSLNRLYSGLKSRLSSAFKGYEDCSTNFNIRSDIEASANQFGVTLTYTAPANSENNMKLFTVLSDCFMDVASCYSEQDGSLAQTSNGFIRLLRIVNFILTSEEKAPFYSSFINFELFVEKLVVSESLSDHMIRFASHTIGFKLNDVNDTLLSIPVFAQAKNIEPRKIYLAKSHIFLGVNKISGGVMLETDDRVRGINASYSKNHTKDTDSGTVYLSTRIGEIASSCEDFYYKAITIKAYTSQFSIQLFNDLRTDRQIGYVVDASTIDLGDCKHFGITIRVQAPSTSAGEIERLVSANIADFIESLKQRRLTVNPAQFDSAKELLLCDLDDLNVQLDEITRNLIFGRGGATLSSTWVSQVDQIDTHEPILDILERGSSITIYESDITHGTRHRGRGLHILQPSGD